MIITIDKKYKNILKCNRCKRKPIVFVPFDIKEASFEKHVKERPEKYFYLCLRCTMQRVLRGASTEYYKVEFV